MADDKIKKAEKEMMEAPDFIDEAVYKRVKGTSAKLIEMDATFLDRSMEEQRDYFRKLASSLNHAAQLIQKERDELNQILFSKEAQLIKIQSDRTNDRTTIVKQLMRHNEEKQKLLVESQGLHAEIKQLKEQLGDDKC